MSDLTFENISVSKSDNPMSELELEFLVLYGLEQAIENIRYYGSDDKFFSIFGNGKIITMWSEYPKLRSRLFRRLVATKYVPWNLEEDKRRDMMLSYSSIARRVYDSVEDSWDISSGPDKVLAADVLSVKIDYLDVLNLFSKKKESITDDSEEGRLELASLEASKSFWTAEALRKSHSEALFDKIYFDIKRAPGSTSERRAVLTAALNNNALSDKIIMKIAKSSPISMKRLVVKGLAQKKWDLNGIYEREKSRSHFEVDEKSLEIKKDKVDKLEAKLMLFAPVVDSDVQQSLLGSVRSENLVWIIPSVSQIGNSWLSRDLERRLNKAKR